MIKNLNELDWFDITNYECVSNFDETQWYVEILQRKYFYDHKPSPKFGSYLTNNKKMNANSHAGDFETDFRMKLNSSFIRSAYKYGDVAIWEQRKLLFKKPVILGAKYKCMEYVVNLEKLPIKIASEDFDFAYLEHFDVPLVMDLNNPDIVLEKAFKLQLDSIRRKRASESKIDRILEPIINPRRIFNESDFNSWTKSGLLPCLDLWRWEKITGNRISTSAIAKVIHGDHSQGKKIRETTRNTHANLDNLFLILSRQLLGKWVEKNGENN